MTFQDMCLYNSINFHGNCRPAKFKKQPFRGVLSQVLLKNFAKTLTLFFLIFLKFRSRCFQETSLSGCFQVINVHSLFSFIFILLAVFTNRILEQFLVIIFSLHSVASFYIYVYDG